MGYYKVESEDLKKIFGEYFKKFIKREDEIRKFLVDAEAEQAYYNDKCLAAVVFKTEPDDVLWKKSKRYSNAWVPTHKTSLGRDLQIFMSELGKEVPKTEWVKAIHYGTPETRGCYMQQSRVSFSPGVMITKDDVVLLSTSDWVDPLWDRSKLPPGAIKEITSEDYRAQVAASEVQ